MKETNPEETLSTIQPFVTDSLSDGEKGSDK